MNEEPRGSWYLLTGLILGLAIGLAISLYFFPVRYSDSEPSALREDYRAEYRRLIAEAYRVDGNLPRAQARLELLRDADPVQALAAQAQRVLAEGGGPDDARPLALLASVLSGATPEPAALGGTASPVAGTPGEISTTPATPLGATTAASTTTPGSPEALTATEPVQTDTPDPAQGVRTATPLIPPTPTLTPRPTFTPRPSATPLPVLQAPFSLVHQSEVCDSSLPPGRIVVEVRDKSGAPLPGVRIQVAWDNGQDTFFTGLAPEISPGYADFLMTAGVTYTLRAGDAGAPVTGLAIPACGGSWKVEFQEGTR